MPYKTRADKDRELWITPKEAGRYDWGDLLTIVHSQVISDQDWIQLRPNLFGAAAGNQELEDKTRAKIESLAWNYRTCVHLRDRKLVKKKMLAELTSLARSLKRLKANFDKMSPDVKNLLTEVAAESKLHPNETPLNESQRLMRGADRIPLSQSVVVKLIEWAGNTKQRVGAFPKVKRRQSQPLIDLVCGLAKLYRALTGTNTTRTKGNEGLKFIKALVAKADSSIQAGSIDEVLKRHWD